MINRVLSFLGIDKMLTEDNLKKGLEKIDPRFKNFFSATSKFGYPAGAAIGFLKSELGKGFSDSKVDPNLRPDEAANLERKRQNEFPQRLVGAATNVAAGGALGGLGGAAISGLGSIMGKPSAEQSNQQQPQKQESAPEQQYDPGAAFSKFPELMKFVSQEASSGGNAQSIASKARKSVKLRTFVNTIEQEIGEPFENLLGRLIGGGQQQAAQPAQSAPQMSQGKQQFLQGMNQLGQNLQALKGKR